MRYDHASCPACARNYGINYAGCGPGSMYKTWYRYYTEKATKTLHRIGDVFRDLIPSIKHVTKSPRKPAAPRCAIQR